MLIRIDPLATRRGATPTRAAARAVARFRARRPAENEVKIPGYSACRDVFPVDAFWTAGPP